MRKIQGGIFTLLVVSEEGFCLLKRKKKAWYSAASIPVTVVEHEVMDNEA